MADGESSSDEKWEVSRQISPNTRRKLYRKRKKSPQLTDLTDEETTTADESASISPNRRRKSIKGLLIYLIQNNENFSIHR